ncbi:MAG TPA: hypothetical protein VGF60_06820, partial [Xanthobacteraceae bacterium]
SGTSTTTRAIWGDALLILVHVMRGQKRGADARERACVPRIPMDGAHGASFMGMAGTSPAMTMLISFDRNML